MHACIHMFTYPHICVYTSMLTYTSAHTYLYVYVCMYIYRYAYVRIWGRSRRAPRQWRACRPRRGRPAHGRAPTAAWEVLGRSRMMRTQRDSDVERMPIDYDLLTSTALVWGLSYRRSSERFHSGAVGGGEAFLCESVRVLGGLWGLHKAPQQCVSSGHIDLRQSCGHIQDSLRSVFCAVSIPHRLRCSVAFLHFSQPQRAQRKGRTSKHIREARTDKKSKVSANTEHMHICRHAQYSYTHMTFKYMYIYMQIDGWMDRYVR